MTATAPGETHVSPGDPVFCRSAGVVGRAIRIAQWWRLRGWKHRNPNDPIRQALRYNHVAVVVGDGLVASAGAKGVQVCPLVTFDTAHRPVSADMFPTVAGTVDRSKVVACSTQLVGTPYAFFGIVGILFTWLTPQWLRLDFRRGGTLVCSAAAAFALHSGGVAVPVRDIYQISPAELFLLAAR